MGGLAKFVILALVGLVLGTWIAAYMMLPPPPVEPGYAGTVLSAASDPVLRTSCYDCHSNTARLLWYDYVPGALQVVAWDIVAGRKELNFSEWNRLSDIRRSRKLREMREQIEKGAMPPWYYTPVHPEAKLSAQASTQLLADLQKVVAMGPAKGKDETPERPVKSASEQGPRKAPEARKGH